MFRLLLCVMLTIPLAACGGASGDEAASDSSVGDAWDAGVESADGERGDGSGLGDEGEDVPSPPKPDGPKCLFAAPTTSMFQAPYPINALRTGEGNLDLSLFPNRGLGGILDNYSEYAGAELDGFSPNTGIYFPFDVPVSRPLLPKPEQTVLDTSAVILVNITPGSLRRGERIPLETQLWDRSDGVYYKTNTLILHPVWGFVMEEGATYAAIITNYLRGTNGSDASVSPEFAAALNGDVEADSRYVAALEPLNDYLAAEQPIYASRIICATVFTVTRPTQELSELQAQVSEFSPDSNPEIPMAIEGITLKENWKFFDRYDGTYKAPNFQQGVMPYLSTGGNFEYDEQGKLQTSFVETLDIAMGVPVGEMPEKGWPVIIHQHGTGGDYLSHFDGGFGGADKSPAGRLATAGFLSIGIDQPMHGNRCLEEGCSGGSEIISFNFLNPGSARSNFRQGALDIFYLVSLLKRGVTFQAQELDDETGEAAPGSGAAIKLDTDRLYLFGHSQGGITGSLVAATEARINGYLLSGAGGGLSNAIIERKDILDFAALFRGQLKLPVCSPSERISTGCEFSAVHPALAMIQGIVDITDPVNYAVHWFSGTYTGRPANIVLTQGLGDEQTPSTALEALVVAGGVPLVKPIAEVIDGLELRGLEPMDAPFSHNIEDEKGQKASTGVFQFPDDDHFAVFQFDTGAHLIYQSFFLSMYRDEPALITWDPPQL